MKYFLYNRVGKSHLPLLARGVRAATLLISLRTPAQSSRGMTFSTARAPGTRQLLLTLFLWVTVRINRKAARIYMQLSDKAVDYRSIMPVPAL